MNIYLDNVNLFSTSGPNHFASKLRKYMEKRGNTFNSDDIYDAQLSFISAANNVAPIYQRLDGIYFNSEQDFKELNRSILETYNKSRGVIFQSNFNKKLTFEYFGEHQNSIVIHNGADLEYIDRTPILTNEVLDSYENVWCCASSWRPHKRLDENIRYFLEHSSEKDCLIVAGSGDQPQRQEHDRVYYVGNLPIKALISLYKRSKYFVHLAYLDHCPNVVVDASACGCHIICSSSGGTKEVAGDATVIEEDVWDLKPIKLYEPPKMDFTRKIKNKLRNNIDMNYVAAQYEKFLGE